MTLSAASDTVRSHRRVDLAKVQVLLDEHRQARLDQIEAYAFLAESADDLDPGLRGRGLVIATTTLAEIDRALARVADGSYGMCAGCTADIDAERLRTLPWTAYCLACASST